MRKEASQLEQDIMIQDEKIGILGKDVALKHDRISVLERDIFSKDRHLLS